MHGLTRTQSLPLVLGYTDIVIYLVFNLSYLINMVMNAFKRNDRCNLQLDGCVVCTVQAWGNHGKVEILVQYL